MAQIGILTTELVRPTLEQTLDAVAEHNLDTVQLHLASVAPEIPTMTALIQGLHAVGDHVSDGLCDSIHAACAARGIGIAAVDGTFNMADPDPARIKVGLQHLDALIDRCARLGTSVVTLCTGSRDPVNMWRPHRDNAGGEAWATLVTCVRQAVKSAEYHGVTLAFEPEFNNVVDSVEKAKRLIKEVGSHNLKVAIDPANIFHRGDLDRMDDVLEDAFSKLGPNIGLAHAKDLDHDGDAGHLAAGHGVLDYRHYLGLLQQIGFHGAVILHGMEGLSPDEMDWCFSFVRQSARDDFWSPKTDFDGAHQ